MKVDKVHIYTVKIACYSEENIKSLFENFDPECYLDLDNSYCYYPGDIPSIGIYKAIKVYEKDIIGLTLAEARLKYPNISVLSIRKAYFQSDIIFVKLDENKKIKGLQ